MNRNKDPIQTMSQALLAARTVYQITKLLKLSQVKYLEMFDVDVAHMIQHANITLDDKAVLQAFARGVRDTYLTILMTEHCEFVYWIDGVKLSVKEAIQKGPDAISGAVCGHQWLDSDFNFSAFISEPDPWL